MTPTVSEQLKRAIDRSGLSRYRICEMSSIDQAAMSRFMAGTRALTCESIDKLCTALDLELVGPPLGTKKARRASKR